MVNFLLRRETGPITNGTQKMVHANTSGTVSGWKSDIKLVEAEYAPEFDIGLDPPRIFASFPGLTAGIMITFNASDVAPAFEREGWTMTVDLNPWLEKIKEMPLENEAIGNVAHALSKFYGGRIKKTLAQAKVNIVMHVSDEVIQTGYSFGATFALAAICYQVNYRPQL